MGKEKHSKKHTTEDDYTEDEISQKNKLDSEVDDLETSAVLEIPAVDFWLNTNSYASGDTCDACPPFIPQYESCPIAEPIVGLPITATCDAPNNNNRAIAFNEFRVKRGKYILKTTLHYVLVNNVANNCTSIGKHNIKWIETFAFASNDQFLPPNLLPESRGVYTAVAIQKKVSEPFKQGVYKTFSVEFEKKVHIKDNPVFWVGFTRSPLIQNDYPREAYVTAATFVLKKIC